jgi:hypothetical protein
MRVLVTCEESQAVCIEFRKRGFEAYSNDVQECSGGHPEWHLQMDAFEAIEKIKPVLLIAHPPCTYLSNAGAVHLFGGGKLNEERYKKGIEAKEFFLKILNCNVPFICVENPIPSDTTISFWASIQESDPFMVERLKTIDANEHSF